MSKTQRNGTNGVEANGVELNGNASNHNHHQQQEQHRSQPPTHSITFGKSVCCFLTREASVALGLVLVIGLVATGLLVYYVAPHPIPAAVAGRDQRAFGNSSLGSSDHTESPQSPGHPRLLPPKAVLEAEFDGEIPPGGVILENLQEAKVEEQLSEEELERRRKRLPETLKPLHYLVKLQPLINGNFSIIGYVEVELEVLQSTSNITLHIADIITHNNTIKVTESGTGSSEVMITSHEYDHPREFYIAHLKKSLKAGHKYTLAMEFTSLLNDNMKGFYRSVYRDDNGTQKLLAATQFQALDARRAFPCLDEPGLKATFEIHLARQINMTTISNMPIKETIPVSGQSFWVWDKYHTTVPMSTYLLAFVVSDFAHNNSTVLDDIIFRVWSRREALPQAQYALDIGPRILAHFADFFNQSYPLPKLDMIAIPDFAPGAMENWGLVTYREVLMLYDPRVSGARNKQRVASVVSHELAHQWFGNLVTPKWWTDIWLNEGFASYVEYLGVDHVEPDWRIMEQFVLKRTQNIFQVDSLESSHPIRHNAIDADKLAYDKGSSIIRMMSHFLGEATFRRGLSDYLSSLKYGNAESDDLWKYLTTAAHMDGMLAPSVTVKTIMDTWTLQTGYPVIKVDRSHDGTTAIVSQTRFLLSRKNSSEDLHNYKWWVPLTYTDGLGPDFSQTQPKVWMKDSQDHLMIPDLPNKDHWVIFNLQQTGYYRVNYDLHNWGLIIKQLLSDHSVIATINRAQIIDDALDLARAGQLPYATALNVLSYLAREVEYVPWSAALDNIHFIKQMFTYTAGYGPLKRYLVDLVGPLFRSVGFEERVEDPLLDQYKRQNALAWACSLELPDCLHKATAAFAVWTTKPEKNTISANLKSTVYCHAIADGGEDEWTFAWDRYLTTNVGSERNMLLTALGCSKKLWILSRYLDMAFNDSSGIRKQDAYRVFSSVAMNDVGRPLAWAYLQNNWDHIYGYFSIERIVMRMVQSVTHNFNTETQLNELLSFQASHESDLSSSALDMAQVVEQTRQNVEWVRMHYKGILDWLDHRGYVRRLPSA